MTQTMKMDAYDGKAFLAAVRKEDFAHAGERESIDLMFSEIDAKPDWKILDAGCGRGGTADYIQQQGWGNVAGIDIDQDSLKYAKQKYPNLEFTFCDILDVGDRFPSSFDLICLFNVFYAVTDKGPAMLSFRRAAKPNALLALFDYLYYKPETPLPEIMLNQKPPTPHEFDTLLKNAGWELEKNLNLDEKYVGWYRRLLERFDAPELKSSYSAETIEAVRRKYTGLIAALENGVMGGALLIARAK